MKDLNGSQAALHVPDFNQELQNAQATGDYDFVLATAKNSHKMLLDFRDAIHSAAYNGRNATAVAMGLNFLENMISNSAGQIAALKQAEKQTRDALKNARNENAEAAPLEVVDPEKPAEPPAVPPAPETPHV